MELVEFHTRVRAADARQSNSSASFYAQPHVTTFSDKFSHCNIISIKPLKPSEIPDYPDQQDHSSTPGQPRVIYTSGHVISTQICTNPANQLPANVGSILLSCRTKSRLRLQGWRPGFGRFAFKSWPRLMKLDTADEDLWLSGSRVTAISV